MSVSVNVAVTVMVIVVMMALNGAETLANERPVDTLYHHVEATKNIKRHGIIRSQNAVIQKTSRPVQVAELIACDPPHHPIASRPDVEKFLSNRDDNYGRLFAKLQDVTVLELSSARQRHAHGFPAYRRR
jgi:hypothetical protein